jgi:formylglycine-generating enzyme required for sulfatase activity
VAAVLALRLLISRSRESIPPREQVPVTPQRPLFPPWNGPTMQIDPDDLARAGEERGDNGLGMKLCWCPPGTFRMGHVPVYLDEGLADGPVSVTLSKGFWMGKFEVTQLQWQTVIVAGVPRRVLV